MQSRTHLVTVTYLGRIHSRRQNKLKLLQNLNFHLKKDIAISNRQIPLVQDKMLLENEHIDKIQNVLNEAKQVMLQTQRNRIQTKDRQKEAVKTCEDEQKLIDQLLNSVCHNLNISTMAGEMSENQFYEMTNGIVDGRLKIEEIEKEITILRVKLENRKTRGLAVHLQNNDEKDILMHQMKLTKRLKSRNKEIEVEIKEKTTEFTTKKSMIRKQVGTHDEAMTTLKEIIYELSMKIDNLKLRTEESNKQKQFYEKNLKKMTREIMKMENQVILTRDELKRMQDANIALNMALDEAQMKQMEMEKVLTLSVATYKKEIEYENKVFLDMTNQIADLEFELRRQRSYSDEEARKLLHKTNEIAGYLTKLKEKINRLSNLRDQKVEAKDNLEEKMLSVEEFYNKELQDSDDYLSVLTPYQIKAEEISRRLERQMEDMTGGEYKMTMEIKLMFEQCKALEALVRRIDVEIEKVKDAAEENNIKLESTNKLYTNTHIRWDQALERIREERRDHDGLMRYRKETLEEILQKKQQNLKENEQLAKQYRTHQATLDEEKTAFVHLAEETLLLKQALKDIKQLLNLQIKMQYNSHHYLQFRGLYHSKQLSYILKSSEGNQVKVQELQFEFMSTMETMTTSIKESMASIYGPKTTLGGVLPKITHSTS